MSDKNLVNYVCCSTDTNLDLELDLSFYILATSVISFDIPGLESSTISKPYMNTGN